VAIFDPQETTTAQRGIYIVFLLRHDGDGLWVSLNQGTTGILLKYGAQYRDVLGSQAAFYSSLLTGKDVSGFHSGQIELGATNRLGRGYEVGAILSRQYSRAGLPTADGDIRTQTTRLIDLYADLLAAKDAVQGAAEPAQSTEEIPIGTQRRRL